MTESTETWVVSFDGKHYGPFTSEDECYAFAARTSEGPNDWEPIQIHAPETAYGFARS